MSEGSRRESAAEAHRAAVETWAAICRSEDGREALKRMRAAAPDEAAAAITEERIARACLAARTYKEARDPQAVLRALAARARGERKSAGRLAALAKAAREIARGLEGNVPGIEWAIWYACAATNVRPADLPGPKRMRDFLDALATALDGPLLESHGGPFLHFDQFGSLLYPHRRGSKKPQRPTMLAFEVTFYLRVLTAGRARDSVQNGQDMPSDGRPCSDVAALFVNAALDTKLKASHVRALLAKLPKRIGLMPWPHVEADGVTLRPQNPALPLRRKNSARKAASARARSC